MKSFRNARFMVLVGMLALVVAVFATSSADAGCGYGGHAFYPTYAPVTYVHKPLVYTYPSCYYPTYYKTFYTYPSCNLYW